MLLFYADPERGKSRAGSSISNICYRSIHTVELREANLFRYSQNFRGTLFFDVKDLWQKAVKSGSEDILLLRYEKGAKVARVLYPERGAFKDMIYYDIYGASIVATNEPLHRIIDSRCIPVTMPNKPGLYSNPKADAGIEFKSRLTAWRAKVLNTSLPEVPYISELSGRLWDISEPLLRICKLVGGDSYDVLKEVLINVAKQRRDEKVESISGQIVQAIKQLSDGKLYDLYDYELESKQVLDKLNENRPDDKKLTSQYLGRRIKALSLKTKRQASGMLIIVNKKELETLLDQYGLSEKNIDEPVPRENYTNYTNNKTEENTDSLDSVVSDVVSTSGTETTLETTLKNSKVSQGDNGTDVDSVVCAVIPEGIQIDKNTSGSGEPDGIIELIE
jgi:hypothetical protein